MNGRESSFLPRPPESWFAKHTNTVVTVYPPERKPSEDPILPYQIDLIRAYSPEIDLGVIKDFGEEQAGSIIDQIREKQVEFCKTRLRKYYAEIGCSASDDALAAAAERYTVKDDSGGRGAERKQKSGCLKILGYCCILWLFLHLLAMFLRVIISTF